MKKIKQNIETKTPLLGRGWARPLFLLLFIIGLSSANAQVGIGTNTPDDSAILDVVSTEKGFLPPRMTTAQRDAIANPANSLVIYNTSDDCLQYYVTASSNWFCIESSAPQQPRVAVFEKTTSQLEEYPFSEVTLDFQAVDEVFNNIGTMNTSSEFIVTDAGYYRLTAKGGLSGDITPGDGNGAQVFTVLTDYFFESSPNGSTWTQIGGDRTAYLLGEQGQRASFFTQYVIALNAGDRVRVRNKPFSNNNNVAIWATGSNVEICARLDRINSKPALFSIEYLGAL